MKTKAFDCVVMKQRGAEKVQEQTRDMTVEQEVAFWRERSHILRQQQEIAKGNVMRKGQRESDSQ